MNVKNNDWLVVRYKPNQIKRVEDNLNNQDLTFYTPKVNKKDFGTQRSVQIMVGKRRKLLDYLKSKDIIKYRKLIKELGLRR